MRIVQIAKRFAYACLRCCPLGSILTGVSTRPRSSGLYSPLSRLSSAFFTTVTLSDWKPLTLRTLHFLLHLPRRAPRVFLRLNCLPASLPSSIATDCLSFPRRCELFLSLYSEHFIRLLLSLALAAGREIRRSPIPSTSPSTASRLARAEISPYIKSGS